MKVSANTALPMTTLVWDSDLKLLRSEAKLPNFMRLAMLASAEAIMSIRPPDVVIGDESDPYVHRWHVIERADHANIYIHRFFRDDHDGALHDHRMRNVSVILNGECDEHFHKEPLVPRGDGFETYAVRRVPGDVVERAADVPHRISLIDRKPMTTMFFTGPKERDWGFHTINGWIHWKKYNERIGNARSSGSYKG